MEEKIYEVAEVKSAETLAVRIRTTVRNTQKIMLDAAISIGQDLVDAKELVDHGEWENWLENSVGFSQSSANKYMQISREFGNNSNSELITNLSYTKALKLLAVPEEDREEFIENHNVEDLTVKELEEKIKELQREKETSETRQRTLEEDLRKVAKEKETYASREQALVDQINELKEVAPGEMSEEAKEEIDRIQLEKLEEIKKIAKEKETAEEKADKLKKQIEQLKEDQKQILENERKKAADDARELAKKESEEEITKLMQISESATKAKQQAEKQLAASSNKEIVQLSIIINRIQEEFGDALNAISNIAVNDQEQADKLRTGLKVIIAKLEERL